MKRFGKDKFKYFIVIFFIGLTIISFHAADRLLSIKTVHGIQQARDMYVQPKNSIDVVFMGSSHVHCDVNTAVLWDDYGIAAYDYSAAEQPLWITYYYLQEICKYQTPKLIVLDLYSPARFKDDYQYTWLRDSLLGVRFSFNKLQMLYVGCEPEHYFDYFPNFVVYHHRYPTSSDIEYLFESKEDRVSFKGYTPYYNRQYMPYYYKGRTPYYTDSPQPEPDPKVDRSDSITIKSEQYLQKIIEFTQKNDMDLYLIVAPYRITNEDELAYNRVKEIADSYGLEFNSTNYLSDEMDLDFDTDFYDDSHLNYKGSCKFTRYLGAEIKENYDIPDRRGLAKWESWDRHSEEVKEAAKEYGL